MVGAIGNSDAANSTAEASSYEYLKPFYEQSAQIQIEKKCHVYANCALRVWSKSATSEFETKHQVEASAKSWETSTIEWWSQKIINKV